MALIKTDKQLEQVIFNFDPAGAVIDIQIQVNYAVRDDVTLVDETRVRKTKSIWGDLTAAQRTAANAVGQRLQALAQNL